MRNMKLIASGWDVSQLQLQLAQSPDLWNIHKPRREWTDSPHREADDIWVRYAPSVEAGMREHDSIWYPEASFLPTARDLAFRVMSLVNGERLGGVLLTRIPPGKQVYPHIDKGWHAEYYEKYLIPIESHPDQLFHFDEGSMQSCVGDVIWFRNQPSHWVINDSPVDRISLIVCVRAFRCLRNPHNM